jgi:hypothetical protein
MSLAWLRISPAGKVMVVEIPRGSEIVNRRASRIEQYQVCYARTESLG